MVQTEKSRLLAKQVMYLVIAHTAIYALYDHAHGMIDLHYVLSEYFLILLIFYLAPFAAALFLFTQSARQGAVLLLGLIPAVLIYTVFTRFTAAAPFIIQEPAFLWKIIYEGSFGIVLVLEVIVTWITFRFLQEIHKKLNSASENPS